MGDDQHGASIRWEVHVDDIDPDRWARAVVDATAANNQGQQPPLTRWGTVPTLLVVGFIVVAIGALTGGAWVIVGLAPAVILICAVVVLNRNSARRLAKHIRSTPAAQEPFTFVADASGTHDTSPTGRSELTWSRYTAVTLDDDLILLTLDGGAIRVLPARSLTTGQAPSSVVAQITDWISAASTQLDGQAD